MSWMQDPIAVRQELEGISEEIPWREAQVNLARAELDAQVARTTAVYGNSYPASSHHAIETLRLKLEAATTSLQDGIAWQAELTALAASVSLQG
jgi:hypothetical protein